jgi:two-component system, cell cycle sensor histidine kinase and response regulator CckA
MKGNANEVSLPLDILAIPVGCVILNRNNTIAQANWAAARLLASEHGRLSNKPFAQFLADTAGAALAKLLAETAVPPHQTTAEIQLLTASGQPLWVQINASRLPDEQGYCLFLTDIDAYKQAESRYQMLVEQSPAVIFLDKADELGTNTYISPQIEKLLGYLPEAYAENPNLWHEQLFPDDYELANASITEVLQTGQAIVEYRMVRRDGRIVWVRDSSVLVRDEQRNPEFIQGFLEDITQRKQHEREQEAVFTVIAALRQAENRADMLPIILDQLIFLMQADGASLAAYDGVTHTAVIEAAQGELSHSVGQVLPVDNSLTGTVITSGQLFVSNAIQQEPELYSKEMFGITRAVACIPLLTQDQPIGAIWVGRQNEFSPGDLRLLTAIADMLANAIYRVTLYEQTVTQAAQIKQIINGVPDGVLLLDEQYKLLLANPAAQSHLQLLAKVRVGDTITFLGNRSIDTLLTSPPVGSWHNLMADDNLFEAIARPLSVDSRAAGWVIVLRDVTERQMVQQQLQQQERLAAIGQLAAGIAHDFNNLMAVITLYSQLLTHSSGLTERDRERLATINKQANHAVRMIQQILDFSRRSVLERQSLDLRPLLRDQIELLRRTLPENIEIIWESEAGEFLVQADPTRLQQAIMNLAVNARDAMPDGGRLTLHLECIEVKNRSTQPLTGLRSGKWVRLAITDTGTGIPAEHLDHLFEPFFTTKTPDKGTGLGLAQVHGIVAQHGGQITVASQLAAGTTFTIHLPLLSKTADETTPEAEIIAPRGRGELILVVEDAETLRTALRDYLQMWGYHTLEAAHGEEALALLAEQGEPVSLILSDVVMPRLGGINLFRKLREQGGQIPIILLTGHPLDEEMIAALRAEGLQAWLSKPPNMPQLAQVIESVLAKSK